MADESKTDSDYLLALLDDVFSSLGRLDQSIADAQAAKNRIASACAEVAAVVRTDSAGPPQGTRAIRCAPSPERNHR